MSGFPFSKEGKLHCRSKPTPNQGAIKKARRAVLAKKRLRLAFVLGSSRRSRRCCLLRRRRRGRSRCNAFGRNHADSGIRRS